MKIDNGINVDQGFVNFICIADDDVHWQETIKRTSIFSIIGDIDDGQAFVTLTMLGTTKRRDIVLAQVTNQAAWTNDHAGVNQAVADICSWL